MTLALCGTTVAVVWWSHHRLNRLNLAEKEFIQSQPGTKTKHGFFLYTPED